MRYTGSMGSVKIGETISYITSIRLGDGGNFWITAHRTGPCKADRGHTQIFGPDGTLIATSPGFSDIPKVNAGKSLTLYTGIHVSPNDILRGDVVQTSIEQGLRSIEDGNAQD